MSRRRVSRELAALDLCFGCRRGRGSGAADVKHARPTGARMTLRNVVGQLGRRHRKSANWTVNDHRGVRRLLSTRPWARRHYRHCGRVRVCPPKVSRQSDRFQTATAMFADGPLRWRSRGGSRQRQGIERHTRVSGTSSWLRRGCGSRSGALLLQVALEPSGPHEHPALRARGEARNRLLASEVALIRRRQRR